MTTAPKLTIDGTDFQRPGERHFVDQYFTDRTGADVLDHRRGEEHPRRPDYRLARTTVTSLKPLTDAHVFVNCLYVRA